MDTKPKHKLTRAHGLAERMLLVRKPRGRFTNVILDKSLTQDILDQSGCAPGAATGRKELFDPEILSPITTLYHQNTTLDKENTVPWSGGGWRGIPVGKYSEHKAASNAKHDEMMIEVHKFAGNIRAHIESQRSRLQGLFDIADYPTAEQFIKCWHYKMETNSVPDSDVRANLDEEERNDIAAQIDRSNAEYFTAAWQHVAEKMADGIAHVAKILSGDTGTKRNSPVNATLIPNLRAQVEVAREMGVAVQDTDLIALANEVEEKLLQLPSEVLAANPVVKEEVGKAAQHLATRAAREVQAVDKRVQDLVGELGGFA